MFKNKIKYHNYDCIISNVKNLYIDEIIYNSSNNLKIVLCEANYDIKKIYKVIYENIISYKITDESFLLKTIQEIFQDKENNSNILKVENSDYINEFHNQTFNIYINKLINHYLILTPNEIIEILSYEEPQII